MGGVLRRSLWRGGGLWEEVSGQAVGAAPPQGAQGVPMSDSLSLPPPPPQKLLPSLATSLEEIFTHWEK